MIIFQSIQVIAGLTLQCTLTILYWTKWVWYYIGLKIIKPMLNEDFGLKIQTKIEYTSHTRDYGQKRSSPTHSRLPATFSGPTKEIDWHASCQMLTIFTGITGSHGPHVWRRP